MKTIPSSKVIFKAFLAFFLITTFYNASAEKGIVLNDTEPYQVITNDYIEILEDTTGKLTINQLVSLQDQVKFYEVKRNYALNENIKSIYWARFKISNKSNRAKK